MLPHLDDGTIIGYAFGFRVTALESTRGGHVQSNAPRGAVLPNDAYF
jgi:hypothetical protein